MTPKRQQALRLELEGLALTLRRRASVLEGDELEQLLKRVRAAVHGQPQGEKAREAHARALLLAFCEAQGEGELKPSDLRTAAERVALGLADAMPEFGPRAQEAKPEIARLIAARSATKPRGRPKGGLARLAEFMVTPDVDAATQAVCKAMGWTAASAKSIARQRQRKKK